MSKSHSDQMLHFEPEFTSNFSLTQLLSGQVAGGIKFRKVGTIRRAYLELTSGEASNVAAISALAGDGKAVTDFRAEGLPFSAEAELAETAKPYRKCQ